MRPSLWVLSLFSTLAAGCSQNFPLGPRASDATPTVQYSYFPQLVDQDTLFYPVASHATAGTTQAGTFGGPVQYSWGNTDISVNGVATALSYPGLLPTGSSPSTALVVFNAGEYGIGGPGDYFVRYEGKKGPDSSIDYNSFSMYFKGVTTPYDVSRYRGFVMFARGSGTWEVGLSGGISAGGSLTDFPYATFNFYSKVFGTELAGTSQWKQFTVYFDAMTQLYGQSVDLKRVLPKAYGLQFDQIAPQLKDFVLDIDYVQMF